jgi:DNA invertase Pin-like site-specific DNA recombinase
MNMILGYVRVSTVEQNESRQLETMQKYNVEKVFSEKVSAKNTDRPKLKELLEFAREGDTIVIHSFSRLARNTKDLLELVEYFTSKNIHLISSKENIDTSTPTGRLLLTVIGAISTFERENTLERQAEGIAIAKKNGVYKGRKPIQVENFGEYYARWKNRECSKADLMKILKISRPTLNHLFAEYEQTLETTT